MDSGDPPLSFFNSLTLKKLKAVRNLPREKNPPMPIKCEILTCAESFPFDAQCPCQTANYPPSSFHRLRSCFDPCNVAAGCDCC